jgi:hypothetical protein
MEMKNMASIENEIEINGVKYVRKDNVAAASPSMAAKLKGLEYCIVRTYSAGVFAGYVKNQKGQEAVVLDARRLWYWDGAASLSQMAIDGTSKPDKCKFPQAVSEVRLTNVIEMIPCTAKAKASIAGVPIWRQ